MTSKLALLLVVLASLMSLSHATEIETTPPFVHQLYVPQINRHRALLLDSAGDILVTSINENITAIRETNHGNGTSTVETTPIFLGTDLRLQHGIAFHNGFFYASSPSTVYRWSYTPGQFSQLNNSTIQVVVTNISTTINGHYTRTIVFDDAGRLYIQVGSQNNIDNDSYRAEIRRFNLGQSFPIQFADGEIFADGTRNTVGLAFSRHGALFGVDNGPDMLNRPDLGGAIWPENPGEEMNKFSNPPGTHYGYPFCWSSYNVTGHPRASQFVWPLFQDDGVHTDAWCQNVANNAPPVLSMPPHSAPLSISFYNGTNCGVNGGFPCGSVDDASVAFRGAWHENVTYGYKVSWYPFNKELDLPTGEVVDVMFAPNPTHSCDTCFRAVSAVFNKAGHLIVTADATNEIFRVAYNWTLPVITNVFHDVQPIPDVPPNSARSIYSNHLLSFALYDTLYDINSQEENILHASGSKVAREKLERETRGTMEKICF